MKVDNKFLNANIIIIIFAKVDKGGGEVKQLSTKSGQFARFHNFSFPFLFYSFLFVQKENFCVTIHTSQEIQCFKYAFFFKPFPTCLGLMMF